MTVTEVSPGRPMTLAQVITACRENLGNRIGRLVEQDEFGALLDPPVSRSTVSRWERGLVEPVFTHSAQIARLGRWSLDHIADLVPGTNPPDDPDVIYLGDAQSRCTVRSLDDLRVGRTIRSDRAA